MKAAIFVAASLSTMMVLTACATAPEIAVDPIAVDSDFPPSLVELNFESHGDRLNGHAYLAEGEGPHPTVVLLHGFPVLSDNHHGRYRQPAWPVGLDGRRACPSGGQPHRPD